MSWILISTNINNGAGIAIVSMDMIKLAVGEPGKLFTHVGGGATPDKILKGCKLLYIRFNRKGLFTVLNIFAVITRCDWVCPNL